jgi:hypothetical protein
MESLSKLASELDDVETNKASTPPKLPPSSSLDLATLHQRSSGGACATILWELYRESFMDPRGERREVNDHGG